MKAYDIFNGVAQENELVAAVIYSQNDYKNIYGGTADQYQDYLLSRHNFLDVLSMGTVVRIIDVPFNDSSYSRWLSQNTYWKDSRESRSAWALDIAKDPKLLSMLKGKQLFPRAPVGEETISVPYFAIIPTLIGSDKDVKALGGKMPTSFLEEIAGEIKSFFKAVPDFKQKSRLRSEGMRVFVGERLVAPRFIEEAALSFQESKDILLQTNSSVFQLPKDCNTYQLFECLNTKNLVFSSVLLPVILHGASSELNYCDGYIEEKQGRIASASDIICDFIRDEIGVNLLEDDVLFLHSLGVEQYLEVFYKKVEIEKPQEVSKKKKNTVLKRIK